VLPQLRGAQGVQMMQIDPSVDLARALTRALAGLLLVLPGLLTEALALIVLLPPVQYVVRRWVLRFWVARQQVMMAQMQQRAFTGTIFGEGGGFSGSFTSGTFDAEAFKNIFAQGGFAEPDSMRDSGRGTTVDGEARVVEPAPVEPKLIGHSANDE
jgi:UPF0716 protein FxsA